jgi:flavin-dependent dehydrogenase
MRVLIAGGGIGGLTTAIALRHQGIDVVNSGDTYGAVPLARIKIVGHMSWEGHIRSPPGEQKVNFVADEAYVVRPQLGE